LDTEARQDGYRGGKQGRLAMVGWLLAVAGVSNWPGNGQSGQYFTHPNLVS
jgi:hypothetical protein